MRRLQVGVIGSAGFEEYPSDKPDSRMYAAAEELGSLLALANCIVINGGKGGVMCAVAKGAKSNGGITVAETSGVERNTSNEYTDVEVITGDLAFRGPSQLVGMCDAIISLGGGAGTLQELCVAYRMQKVTVLLTGYGGWTDKVARLEYMDERCLIAFKKVKTAQQAIQCVVNLL